MAYCKVCNSIIADETEICDDCNKKMVMNDELYLDRLLAAVTNDQNEPYQQVENNDENLAQLENEYKPLLFREEDLEKQSSKDDDWNLLNQTMKKNPDNNSGSYVYNKEIPSEGAIDEVESILVDDYGMVLEDMPDNPDTAYYDMLLKEEVDSEQDTILDDLIFEEVMANQDDIMGYPDNLVEEDMENPLVNPEVIEDLDIVNSELYNGATVTNDSKLEDESKIELDNEVEELEIVQAIEDVEDQNVIFDEDDFLSSLLEVDVEEPGVQESNIEELYVQDTNVEELDVQDTDVEELDIQESMLDDSVLEDSVLEEPVLDDSVLQDYEVQESELQDFEVLDDLNMDVTMDAFEFSEEQQPVESNLTSLEPEQEVNNFATEMELDDELFELNKLLGEVTENVEDFSIDRILSTGISKQEEDINTSDVLKRSLSAVSSLDDPDLEAEFNNILPNENPSEETKKVSIVKKLFGNVVPENSEEEKNKLEQEELLEQERKKKKEEEKQQKAALKEENKAKKAELKEAKEKNLVAEKEKRKKAREAIASAYVPEGKINKAGAFIVFVVAACVAFVIIQGSSFASYNISVKRAEKDFNNSRYDEAYETLSGEKLKEKDEVVYDKLQTIMVVKKELNSYYNFKRINMELEALHSVIKGIDRYKRYYANAKELEVDKELNQLKDEMLTILKDNYNLSEKDTLKLIDIEDGKQYTDRLIQIVDRLNKSLEDTEQVANKN